MLSPGASFKKQMASPSQSLWQTTKMSSVHQQQSVTDFGAKVCFTDVSNIMKKEQPCLVKKQRIQMYDSLIKDGPSKSLFKSGDDLVT